MLNARSLFYASPICAKWKIVVREALSESELINFSGIGTLESWNSDGLRTILKKIKAPDMIEKTLRYIGTIEYLKVLRESGFFSYEKVEVDGKLIRDNRFDSKTAFPNLEIKRR